MIKMFKQLFSAITILFEALEMNAQSIKNLSEVGTEMSGEFLDKSRTERAQALIIGKAEIKQLKQAM